MRCSMDSTLNYPYATGSLRAVFARHLNALYIAFYMERVLDARRPGDDVLDGVLRRFHAQTS